MFLLGLLVGLELLGSGMVAGCVRDRGWLPDLREGYFVLMGKGIMGLVCYRM
jgi:hypothetical protein